MGAKTDLLTAEGAAVLLQITPEMVYRHARAGLLAVAVAARPMRFRHQDVIELGERLAAARRWRTAIDALREKMKKHQAVGAQMRELHRELMRRRPAAHFGRRELAKEENHEVR